MDIEIILGDILTATTDCIVNPTNSQGIMATGVGAAIVQAGGSEIEEAAQDHSPSPVGNAYRTTAGALPFKGIVHTPTMEHPNEPIPVKQVELATVAALRCADEAEYTSIAFPLLGTGVGDVRPEDAAQVMLETIEMYMVDNNLETAVVYAYTEDQLEALQQYS